MIQIIDNIDATVEGITKAVQDSLEDIGQSCCAEVQSNTPVLTGNLRKSMDYQTVSETTEVIGTDCEYACRNEFEYHPGFFRTSLETNADNISEIICNKIKSELGL